MLKTGHPTCLSLKNHGQVKSKFALPPIHAHEKFRIASQFMSIAIEYRGGIDKLAFALPR
jgi:hypothetical protein